MTVVDEDEDVANPLVSIAGDGNTAVVDVNDDIAGGVDDLSLSWLSPLDPATSPTIPPPPPADVVVVAGRC